MAKKEENSGVQRPSMEAPKPSRERTPEELIAMMYPARYRKVRKVNVELKPGYVLRKVGQAYMVMPTGPRMKDYQGMITLNETGAFMYRLMEKQGTTEEDLQQACMKEYDATEEEANQAVDMFVRQCAECGLFEYVEAIFDAKEEKIIEEDEIDQDVLKFEEEDRARLLKEFLAQQAEKEAQEKAQKE